MCYVLVAGSWEYCLLVVNEWEFKRTVSTSPMGKSSSSEDDFFFERWKWHISMLLTNKIAEYELEKILLQMIDSMDEEA